MAAAALAWWISNASDEPKHAPGGGRSRSNDSSQWSSNTSNDSWQSSSNAPPRDEFPLPGFLEPYYKKPAKYVNIGITGQSGQGKSAFNNFVRFVKKGSAEYAEEGHTETTMEPKSFGLGQRTLDYVRVWDLPGAGTSTFPANSYLKDMGLRYFDMVILVVNQRVFENDVMVVSHLQKYGVPFIIVRTKMDQDVQNVEDEEGDIDQVFRDIREDLAKKFDVSESLILLTTSRVKKAFGDCKGYYDTLRLAQWMNETIKEVRQLPQVVPFFGPDGSFAKGAEHQWKEDSKSSDCGDGQTSRTASGRSTQAVSACSNRRASHQLRQYHTTRLLHTTGEPTATAAFRLVHPNDLVTTRIRGTQPFAARLACGLACALRRCREGRVGSPRDSCGWCEACQPEVVRLLGLARFPSPISSVFSIPPLSLPRPRSRLPATTTSVERRAIGSPGSRQLGRNAILLVGGAFLL